MRTDEKSNPVTRVGSLGRPAGAADGSDAWSRGSLRFIRAALACFCLLVARAPGQQQLISNGGFESGLAGWTAIGNFYANCCFPFPHTGAMYLYFSNSDATAGNNLSGTCYQQISIPANASSATLSYWYNISSAEGTATAFDFLFVRVLNTSGTTLATLATYSNVNQTSAGSYSLASGLSLNAFIGQTIRVAFVGSTDTSLPTVFRIDDVSVAVTTPQTPASPTSLVAVGSSNNVLLQWQDNATNETGFKIERKTGAGGTWNQIATPPAFPGVGTDAVADNGLAFGNTYYYRVYAYNGAGNSPFPTNEAAATTLATPVLAAPADGATIAGNNLTLQWSSVPGAEVYGIDMGTSCGSTNTLNNQASASTSYPMTLANGTYVWRLRAANSTAPGVSAVSACRSFTVACLAPATPTATAPGTALPPGTTIGTLTPTMQWTAVSDATSYELDISESPYGSAHLIYSNANIPTTSFVLPVGTLQVGTAYRWQVSALNACGQSIGSNLLYFQTESTPSAPLALAPGITIEPGAFIPTLVPSMFWEAPPQATSYSLSIYRKPYQPMDLVQSVGNIVTTSLQLQPGLLKDHTTYRWSVSAVNGSGVSPPSSTLYFTTNVGMPTLRVSVKRILDAATQQPGISTDLLDQWLNDADSTLQATCQIKLDIESTEDLVDPMAPASWFNANVDLAIQMEAAAQADPCKYKWESDAVNVYVTGTRYSGSPSEQVGGASSYPIGPTSHDIVFIAGSGLLNSGVGIAHEIGHYLNLRHTHALYEYQLAGDCPAGAGDCVADTPDDANPALWSGAAFCSDFKQALLTLAGQQGYTQQQTNSLLFNVMSYHCDITPGVAVLTPGQRQRALSALYLYRADKMADSPVQGPACPWTFFGSGLAGTQGVPLLAGSGDLSPGATVSLSLTSAKPHSVAVLFASLSTSAAPFKGGTLYSVPPVLQVSIMTTGAGDIQLSGTWPAGLPAGASIYFQYGIDDAGAVQHVALSNALCATQP